MTLSSKADPANTMAVGSFGDVRRGKGRERDADGGGADCGEEFLHVFFFF